MAYARYTEFTYDPDRRDEVVAFWNDPTTSHPTGQPGFQRGYVLDSAEEPGRLRVVTVWEGQQQFDDYYATPGHQAVGPDLAERSARIVARDGLGSVLELEAPSPAGHIRIIRARVKEGTDLDALRTYWRTEGRAALEAAPGNHGARAFLDEAAGIFVIQVFWETEEAAIAYVASDDHHEKLTVPLDRFVVKLDRADATPLD